MMKSMTGYGSAEAKAAHCRFTVEIRSVNKKSLDLHVGLPKELAALESEVVGLVSKKISRGRVSVSITHDGVEKPSDYLVIDEKLAEEYCKLLKKLQRKLKLRGEIDLGMILSAKEVIKFRKPVLDVDESWKAIRRALKSAIAELISMREAEGKAISGDIEARRKKLMELVVRIEKLAPAAVQKHSEALSKRIRAMGKDIRLDEDRLMMEVAVFADRSDITEEITRLRSHLAQFEKLMAGTGPVGRTLDFLTQEMFREINTVGSKANSAEISSHAVYFKTELEKIREQVQNIE